MLLGGTSALSIRRNRVYNNEQSGVFIIRGEVVLEENEIFSNGGIAVTIDVESGPTLRRNRIRENKEGVHIAKIMDDKTLLKFNEMFSVSESGGDVVAEDGKFLPVHGNGGEALLEDNEIFSNKGNGVAIRGGSVPTLRRNQIRDNEDGVHIGETSKGILEDNEIVANKRIGVDIFQSTPTLRRNRIHSTKEDGIHFHEGSGGILEDNDVFSNEEDGVLIKDASNPVVRNNRINRNKGVAIRVEKSGEGLVENNDLRSNEQGAWSVSSDNKSRLMQKHNQE